MTDGTGDPPTAAPADQPPGGDPAGDDPAGDGTAGDGAADDGASAARRRQRRSERFDLPRAATLALGIGGGIILAQLVAATAARLQTLLVLVLISLFLSFAMEPAVQWLHQRGVRRGVGTGLVFLSAALLIGGLAASMYGLLVDQVSNLVQSAPELLDDLAARANELPEQVQEPVADFLAGQSEQLPSRINDVAALVGRSALGLGTTLLGTIFSGLAVLLLTFYLVADGPRLRWQLSRRLEPTRQREFLQVWELAIAKTGGYVYSRVLLAVLSAIVHITAFQFAGLPYATALGAWVGVVSSVIPAVGLYIASVLPIIVALANPDEASIIVVLVVITVYQQVENYLVQPRVTAHSLSLHPAVAFLSVLAGAALLGAAGALLALPAAAIVAALVTAYAEEHDVMEHGLTSTPEARVAVRDRGSWRPGRGQGRAAQPPDSST